MTTATELILVPRPQRLEITGVGPVLSTAVTQRRVEGVPAQGFDIDITADTVELRYSDDAGLRYGRGLLDQIRRQCDADWPAMSVRDWPDFAVRGYMLDISRGRVPTRQTLERVVGLLELVRVNHLELYTEHTFAYSGHEKVWRDASPMTADDIHWLDQRCRSAGIELVANQNCFGHMEHWFVHDEYRHRAEMPEGFKMFGVHRPAMTLAPTADNAEFVLSLLDELLPHFTSRTVNIGCDETWELGRGASAADAAERGKGRVYLEYLQRLLTPLLDKGYSPQFWGDIISNDPELVAELPSGATAVAWDYEGPWTPKQREQLLGAAGRQWAAEGLDLSGKIDGFASTAAPFIEAGYPFWVAPGTSTWTSLIGRLDNAYRNLSDTAQVGRSGGATGFLITDWGDRGHLQPPSVSFPPLLYGASVAWSLDANEDLNVTALLDRFVFDDPTAKLGSAMDVLGRAWSRTGQVAFNSSPLQAALVSGRFVVAGEPDADQLTQTLADLEDAMGHIEASAPRCGDGDTVKQELIAATRLARHGGRRLLGRTGVAAVDNDAMREDLAEAIALHRQAWALRSRPGGMERGLAGLEETLAAYGD
jgi:hexosaminidase